MQFKKVTLGNRNFLLRLYSEVCADWFSYLSLATIIVFFILYFGGEPIRIIFIVSLMLLIQLSASLELIWNAIISIELNENETGKIIMEYKKGFKSYLIEFNLENYKINKTTFYSTLTGNTTRYTFYNLDEKIVCVQIRNSNKESQLQMESALVFVDDFIKIFNLENNN